MSTRSVGLVVGLSLVMGCGGGSAEPTTSEETETTEGTEATEATTDDSEATDEERPALAGGWGEGDVNGEGPREAAAFAVQEQSRVSGDTIVLVSIASVSQQVVSGINYRLVLNITRNGTAEQANAEVYSQPWTSTTRLTGWTSGPAH